jgi:transcriptional regulator with XRE-family HTH domain
MTLRKSFGEQLREERKKQGLTVQVTADACGISRSYITLIENGVRQPGKKILQKIALGLNLKTSVVLNWYLDDLREKLEK